MDLFEKMIGHCQVRNMTVEILNIRLKKTKQKAGALNPVRCNSSADCPRGSFCRFVNPLTTRIPVTYNPTDTDKAAAS